MKASDIMTLGAATVTPESSLAEAIRCMGNHNISALPVVDRDGELHGLISEGDFFRKATDSFRLDSLFDAGREVRRDALDSTRVGELMSTELVTVDGDVSLTDAIGLMERHGVKRLPVISNGKLVGLISRADILRTLLDE
ncbi:MULTISPECIES: CBS domain-containing protein [Sphingomonadaceae]|jgi:CBS domain-containing protein|uniref:CBS domain-containing protein n=1 Tax=Sphingomonadales TaxID=204457 RepID=UPI00082EF9B3|nr:CBS domain-containing protein [Sphingopyxis granuli]MCF8706297.1 CBS domain-containing protein [Rhizorhapis sp. SPR117]SCW86930.1 CBS domain-containing protein [Sphingobium faniae]